MQYDYKVDSIVAGVTEGDLRKGQGGQKVAGQVEIKLNQLAKQGFEFYREFAVDVSVASGCGSKKESRTIQIIVMVFRREVR